MTFNIAWVLLKDEREENQHWYLDQLRRLTRVKQIRMHFVIICD